MRLGLSAAEDAIVAVVAVRSGDDDGWQGRRPRFSLGWEEEGRSPRRFRDRADDCCSWCLRPLGGEPSLDGSMFGRRKAGFHRFVRCFGSGRSYFCVLSIRYVRSLEAHMEHHLSELVGKQEGVLAGDTMSAAIPW